MLTACACLCKVTKFIQLSLTLTKLCLVKCNHLVNFYLSLQKRDKLRYLCNSTPDIHKFNKMMQNMSVWLSFSKFQDGRQPLSWKSTDCIMSWLCRIAVPSVLWHCWLGGLKGIRPVKNWVVGCWHGYLSGARCRLACGPVDATATHCLLLHLNLDWFCLLVPPHPGSPGQRAVKRVCVCVWCRIALSIVLVSAVHHLGFLKWNF